MESTFYAHLASLQEPILNKTEVKARMLNYFFKLGLDVLKAVLSIGGFLVYVIVNCNSERLCLEFIKVLIVIIVNSPGGAAKG